MRVVALDLGTNTFLCLIADGDRHGIRSVLRDEVEIVRLGQDVDRTGELHPEALQRARATLTRFRKLIDDTGGVDRVLGVATSAARDVRNGHELLGLGDELNLPLKVIAGSEEARLSYAGACADCQDQKHRLVVDIGGGSTELILGRGRDLLFSRSVDMGGVRLTERMIPKQPVPPADREKVRQFVRDLLKDPIAEIKKNGVDEIIAVAGTPTTLAAVELGGFDRAKVDGYELTLPKLKDWADRFAAMSVEEKRTKYQLGGRADIIFAGVTILCGVVEALGMDGVKTSVKGLRYGLALDLLSLG